MKFLLAALAIGLAAPAGADSLQLSFDNGFVTLTAKDVPVSRILAEWARLGQTHIVNGERLGATITLELPHVPEMQALETLLRSAGGYLVAARGTAAPGLSRFDRIMVMPTAPGPPVSVTSPPMTQQPPVVQQPPPPPPPGMVDDQDEPIQPPGLRNPNQPPAEQPPGYFEDDDDSPTTDPAQGLPAPGIQPMPPAPVPPGGQPGQPMPDNEGAQPPAGPVAVPGQGAVVSPSPGQLPLPPPQPNPR